VLFLILSTSLPSVYSIAPSSPASSTSASSPTNPYGSCKIASATFSKSCKWELDHTRVAVINSIFTSTAYFSSSGSFYTFYGLFAKSKSCVTQDLNLLNLTTYRGWSQYEQPLQTFVRNDEAHGLLNKTLLSYLTDIDVNKGGTFSIKWNHKAF
jgi:hypothetical protein